MFGRTYEIWTLTSRVDEKAQLPHLIKISGTQLAN